MIIKLSDNPVLEDNPTLAYHPVLSRLEDKHLRWIALYLDPWSPLRFAEEDVKLRTLHSMVPGVRVVEHTWRPDDADVLLWPKALEAYCDLCPDIGMVEAISARRNLIDQIREEEEWKMPSSPKGTDLNRHKARLDTVHRKILSKAVDELEEMYGRLQFKPVITTAQPLEETGSGAKTGDRSHIDNVSFQ